MSAVTELNWLEPLNPLHIARVVTLDNAVQYEAGVMDHMACSCGAFTRGLGQHAMSVHPLHWVV